MLFILTTFLGWGCTQKVKSHIGEVVFSNDDVKITQLEDNMWVVETSDNTTMYIVEGTERAALIDTGTECADLDKIVQGITQKPLYVIVTHYHGDHAGNVKYFDEIYLHPADTVLVARSRKPYDGKINFMNEGDIFDLGGGTKLEVLYTPAHTPGSVCLLDRKAGICYSGDAFGSNDVWLQSVPSSPIATYVNSCDKMLAEMDKGIDRLYCGHYVYITNGWLDRKYVETMKELAISLEDGSGLENAKPYDNQAYKNATRVPSVVSKDGVNIVFFPEYLK